jgi:ribosomal protein S18 acetylase RimI-like enzyme
MHSSPTTEIYTIGWLAVAQQYRRQGLGQRLVEHALGLVSAPAEVVVTTFGEDNPEGQAARRFYERLGFQPAEAAAPGPEGGTRQIFRLLVP